MKLQKNALCYIVKILFAAVDIVATDFDATDLDSCLIFA